VGLVWLHNLSDALIWLAYITIPLVLVSFARRRRDLPFPWMFWMFGAFIIGCGTTHLMEILTTYLPVYRLSGLIKLLTAGVSVATAIALVPLVPKALALRSPTELEHEITERRQAEKALQQSEERFRLLLEGVKDYAIFMLHPDGRVASWNAGAQRIKGYFAEEIIGQHFSRFYTPEDLQLGKPERALSLAAAEGRYQDEGGRVRKDGSRFWANVVVTALHNDAGELKGFAKVTRDVTERKQTEENFRGLLESAPDAMVIVGNEGKIVLVNKQTEKLFGYPREELLGQPVEILVPARFRTAHAHYRSMYYANPSVRPMGAGLQLHGRRKDGTEFPVEISLSPLVTEGGTLVSGAIRDITERKRVEERAHAFAAQLQRSNKELELFASVASHDLQEPLRKIQTLGDRLQAKCGAALGDQGREYLERMQHAASRMRTLITDLLTFARLTSRIQPFVLLDLTQAMREVLLDLDERLHETGGRVEVQDLPTVHADPAQMHRLFQNLISNGLKFHRPGEPPLVKVFGKICNPSEPGCNGATQGSGLCQILVEDNGIGFEEIYQERIFEIFQRLHGRNEYEGSGIGLAICRKIVERHGGCITAKSTPGQGATFTVTLPVRQSEEMRHEEAIQTDHRPDGRG
jgi:PAS domain S-box-containing protein